MSQFQRMELGHFYNKNKMIYIIAISLKISISVFSLSISIMILIHKTYNYILPLIFE